MDDPKKEERQKSTAQLNYEGQFNMLNYRRPSKDVKQVKIPCGSPQKPRKFTKDDDVSYLSTKFSDQSLPKDAMPRPGVNQKQKKISTSEARADDISILNRTFSDRSVLHSGRRDTPLLNTFRMKNAKCYPEPKVCDVDVASEKGYVSDASFTTKTSTKTDLSGEDVFGGKVNLIQEELKHPEIGSNAHIKEIREAAKQRDGDLKKEKKPCCACRRKDEELRKETEPCFPCMGAGKKEEPKNDKDCFPCMEGFMENVLKLENEDDSKECPSVEDVKFVMASKLPKSWTETILVRSSELSVAQKDAFLYMEDKKIEQLFSFLICHALWKAPEQPLLFFIDLLGKCLQFRSGFGEPPLLFDLDHQNTMYRGLDPSNAGVITYEQYCNGLKTMGIKTFNKNPKKTKNGMIEQAVFLEESDKRLLEDLVEMLCAVCGMTESRKAELAKRKKPVELPLVDYDVDYLQYKVKDMSKAYYEDEYDGEFDDSPYYEGQSDVYSEENLIEIIDQYEELHDAVVDAEIQKLHIDAIIEMIEEIQVAEIEEDVNETIANENATKRMPDIDEDNEYSTEDE